MGGWWRRGGRPRREGELGEVGADGDLDAKLLVVARLLIILGDALADLAGAGADDRVGVGVVVVGAAEDFDAEGAFFEGVAAGEAVFDDVAEEGGVAFGAAEEGVGEEALELQADGGLGEVVGQGLLRSGFPLRAAE